MKTYNVWIKNEKKTMTYEDICNALNISPEVNFVKVTNAGSISFTAGKPVEIRFLHRMCRENGFRVSKDLTNALKMC